MGQRPRGGQVSARFMAESRALFSACRSYFDLDEMADIRTKDQSRREILDAATVVLGADAVSGLNDASKESGVDGGIGSHALAHAFGTISIRPVAGENSNGITQQR